MKELGSEGLVSYTTVASRPFKTRYPTGISSRVRSMFVISPPITAMARGCCIWATGAEPQRQGNQAKDRAEAGHQDRPEPGATRLHQGLISGIPWSRSWPMYSIRMMPFFTSRPISRMAPMNDETFSGVPVIQRANSALASETGCDRKISIGRTQAVKLEAEEQEDQAR